MIRHPALLLALLAALLPAAARADGWSPLGFSFAANSLYGGGKSNDGLPSYECEVDGLRLALFGGANVRMRGVSVGVFANGLWTGNGGDGDAAGIQVAGVFNDADSANYGVMQFAGAANLLGKSGSVFQVAGLFNSVYGDGAGIQLAGFVNTVSESFAGVQVAGVVNYVEDDFSGLQIGAINLAYGTMNGVQLGVVNYGGKVNGVQIGLINTANSSLAGIQVGLLNVVDSSRSELSGMQLGMINGWGNASYETETLPFIRIYF